ncbi:SDR family NAD(P)-dependent oxidoreductase [Pseudomaricurvus alkylphenolicus]|uniref:SDR family NAD(P)-dependent oxidoreductase n=1 Tax=Pseudomaricurvus alkylphenolicus TaxID=1306991 RepID=UPI001424A464|nr:SDR family NAD(P)-dependent oxidoreductase [Pseudomaricurvus alkylphenolicus]NIB41736.1 SDR family NAD(P)-dependent oxidoreductase [Pseudomaricurvus alkylphenolicus]
MNQWNNKVAVITGAASGIGSGLARYAAKQGMRVIAADVDTQGLEALEKELKSQELSIITTVTDVSDPRAVEELAAAAFETYGKVNFLFNNAGVLVDGKSWERTVKDWQWCLNVNVMGVVNGIRSFVPRMLQQQAQGRVINTSSIGGLLRGGAFLGPYQGTKHFITAITETLYSELSQESAPVTASVLCPAEVATGIWNSDRLRSDEQSNPLGSEAEQQFRNLIAEGVAKGLSTDEFAARVFAGIEADKFWLLPQPEFKPAFQLRAESILNESNPMSTDEMVARLMNTEG